MKATGNVKNNLCTDDQNHISNHMFNVANAVKVRVINNFIYIFRGFKLLSTLYRAYHNG